MILATSQVTVASTAGGSLVAAERAGRAKVVLINHGTIDVFIGQNGVAAGTGALLSGTKGQALTIEAGGAAVYAIAASSTQVISVIETG